MPNQTTSAAILIHASAASLPFPASKIDATAGVSIAPFAAGRQGLQSPELELFLEASANVTLANVRALLFEDSEWAIAAQAGGTDVLFSSLALLAGFPVRFALGSPGRATRIVLTADAYAGATITASVKRVDIE